MSLSNRKITTSDITSKGVVAAPDTMTGTAQENKMVFDRLIREVVKDDMNGVIDDLTASTAAAELGFDATEEIDEDNIQDAIEFLYSSGEAGVAKATEEALKSEGYAVGKQNGVDVASGSVYYHNNSKYYSQQASNSADTATAQAGIATTKAGNASDSATIASGYANDALGYRNTTEGYKNDASNYKDAASASALSASGSATAAGNSETNSAAKALVSEGYALGKQNGVDVGEGSEYYHNNAKYFKEQAGEASVGYVSYASAQSIPTSGKLQARTNIDAEDFGNKVTSVNSSSTDTQYPSAKLLYDTKTAINSSISTLNEDKANKEALNKYMGGGWNQLLCVSGSSVAYVNSYTCDVQGTITGYPQVSNIVTTVIGHKYLYSIKASANNGIRTASSGDLPFLDSPTIVSGYSAIITGTGTSSSVTLRKDTAEDQSVTRFMFNLTDLTELFGSGHEPTTVSQFKALYSADWYPFSLPNINNTDNEYMITMDGFISPTINGIKNYWDGSLYHRRIARVDLGSLDWTYELSETTHRFWTQLASLKTETINIYSTAYLTDTIYSVTNERITTGGFHTGKEININDSAYSDALAFKQAMSGKFVYYELDTEQTCNIDANGLRFDLLWENASPSASFGAQTISLDLSKYKFLHISFTDYGNITCDKNNHSEAIIIKSDKIRYRVAYTINNSIVFTDCIYQASYGSYTIENTSLIPTKVYGVR